MGWYTKIKNRFDFTYMKITNKFARYRKERRNRNIVKCVDWEDRKVQILMYHVFSFWFSNRMWYILKQSNKAIKLFEVFIKIQGISESSFRVIFDILQFWIDIPRSSKRFFLISSYEALGNNCVLVIFVLNVHCF